MKLEIERKQYCAGDPTKVTKVLWDVTAHAVDGEEAIGMSPQEVEQLVETGQLLYYEERSIVRLKVLRNYDA
jgi:hypothetical protein